MQTIKLAYRNADDRLVVRSISEIDRAQDYQDKLYLLSCINRGAGTVPGVKFSDVFALRLRIGKYQWDLIRKCKDPVYLWMKDTIQRRKLNVQFNKGKNDELNFVVLW